MQLKNLEAYGFKSFADKIEVEFDKGITAIVGPNGSGKSNISDAIKWVLGEQNVRNLRGVKAEDIIFTGSETRRQISGAIQELPEDMRAPDEVYEERLRICEACEKRIALTCTLCGCYIQARAAKKKLNCPYDVGGGKW